MNDSEKAQALVSGLTQVTINLAAYVKEQAQLIARPKIEEAEGRFRTQAAHDVAAAVLRAERAEAVITELRRQISVLERREEKSRAQIERVRTVADALEARDMHGAALDIRHALNATLPRAASAR